MQYFVFQDHAELYICETARGSAVSLCPSVQIKREKGKSMCLTFSSIVVCFTVQPNVALTYILHAMESYSNGS